jgi:hypothetical protein
MSSPDPFDMNKVMAVAVNHELDHRVPMIIAQSLVAAGNSLRAQAFQMTAGLTPQDFIAQPAKMSDGGSIVLLRALKYVGGTYRMIVGPAFGEDGTIVGRAIIVFDEVEGDLVKTQFLKLSAELEHELKRQIETVQLAPEGVLELCLAIIPQAIEGYEYFADDTNPHTAHALAVKAGETPPDDAADSAAEPAADASPTDAAVPAANDGTDAVAKEAAPTAATGTDDATGSL